MIAIPFTPEEIFSHLPPNRCGEADRRYMDEILESGFSNRRESAEMLKRFEEELTQLPTAETLGIA